MLTVGQFWETVTLYCREFDGSVTSGIRSRARNAAVGGVAHSAHVQGLGADVVLDDWHASTSAARAAWLASRGVTLIAEHDHDHLQPAGWTPG